MSFTNPTETDRASSDHAGQEEDISFEFGSGIDLMHPPHKIQEGYVQRLENMYYPRETAIPQTRPGTTMLEDVTDPVTGIHVYRYSETVSWVVYTINDSGTQKLYYLNAGTPVELSADLGSTDAPSFVTFNGCLLVTVGGYIYEWQGFTAVPPAATAAHATGDVTFSDEPTEGDTVTFGDEVFTFTDLTSGPFDVALGTTAATAATNLETAINKSSSLLSAVVHVGDNTVCHVSARRVGAAGNMTVTHTDAADDFTVANLAGGVDGMHLDQITTYGAPQPHFMVVDQNQRLVAAGDATYPDRVFFSSPADHWQWATGAWGGGETFDLGYRDGTDITAIHPMLGNLVVHKAGQGREIFRITTLDPDPTNWTASMKKFHANTSAINHRCVAGVTDKTLFLDTRGFSTLSGSDTYDEIMVGAAGMMLGPSLKDPDPDDAFFIVHPDETYVMVFPRQQPICWVFHYGSGRWSKFSFTFGSDVNCGCYDDVSGTVLLGTSAGHIYQMDPTVATDDGVAFRSEIQTRAIGGGTLKHVLVKQTLLDWRHIIAGRGYVALLISNEDEPSQQLFEFELEDAALLLRDTDLRYGSQDILLYADAGVGGEDLPLLGAGYGRVNSFEQGGGELVSLRIRLTSGAYALQGATVKAAYHGRIGR